ncbi:MAG: HDOD domain-containing protein [Ignavibacteriales bacterium]|nr:HDOD domain-containing protein [Ignavibacteriales bacterium]
MRDIRSEIEKINEIVSLPTVLAEIMGELDKGDGASNKIIKLIETDPVLTGNVLRAVNSPFYGLRWRVNSVPSAIALLGLAETSRILVAVYIKQKLFAMNSGQRTVLEALWKHSINTAAIARLITKEYGILTGGKEFTAGLMHDMGKIVLIQYFPTELETITRMVRELELNDVQVENQIVAISHDEIGGVLGERWRLPHEFVEVMRFHHTPSKATINPELTTVVRFADLLAEHWMCGIGENPPDTLFDNDESFSLLAQHEPRIRALGVKDVVDQLAEKFVEQKSLVGVF